MGGAMDEYDDRQGDNFRALWDFLDRSSRQWHRLFEEPEEKTGFEPVERPGAAAVR